MKYQEYQLIISVKKGDCDIICPGANTKVWQVDTIEKQAGLSRAEVTPVLFKVNHISSQQKFEYLTSNC